jgi:CobQ-like glutamine amidotransferase family enzyme
MKTVRLAAFHHDRLNLNGDLLNLLVLAKRLNWRGIGCEVVELNGRNFNQHLAKGIDFALLGHGSIAAWSAIDADDPGLETAILSLVDRGVPVMGVATGYERLVKFGILHSNITRGPRVSEFTECEFGSQKLVGYINSDSGLPPMSVDGNIYGTLLHGPVLAKNPTFADELLGKILSSNLRTLDNEQIMFADEMAKAATEVARGMLAS